MYELSRRRQLQLCFGVGVAVVVLLATIGLRQAPAAAPLLTPAELQQLDLQLSPASAGPGTTATQAQQEAQAILGFVDPPDQVIHALSSQKTGDHQAWVVVWAGGPLVQAGPAGPGAAPLVPRVTGAVFDDQSGELLYWFQTASQ